MNRLNVDMTPDLETLNEMFIKVEAALPAKLENSIFYSRIKNVMAQEIMKFLREQTELKSDLMRLKDDIGDAKSEKDIRREFDKLMKKYNSADNNVGLIYHIEATRVDYGVPVMVMIKREVLHVKKFVFRYKKTDMSTMKVEG